MTEIASITIFFEANGTGFEVISGIDNADRAMAICGEALANGATRIEFEPTEASFAFVVEPTGDIAADLEFIRSWVVDGRAP